jgi:hypothetical protein
MNGRSFEPGIEVNGICVESIVDAFKLFPSVALKRLLDHGIGTLRGKEIYVDRQAWYPIQNWLAAHDAIAETVGGRALFQVGQYIPRHAPLPPGINDIHSALGSVDAAYHMNHRKKGKVMFDPATGEKLGGIGSYGYAPADRGERKITSVCDNPYPCDFDRGLLAGFAQRFEKLARIAHDDRGPCRKTGGSSCTYIVTW